MPDESDAFRAYVAHLGLEHKQLRDCLRQIEQQWQILNTSADPTDVLAQIRQSLNKLRADLAQHFRQEEVGGCLDEAVAHQPRFSHEVAGLIGQHSDLLGQLDRLIQGLSSFSHEDVSWSDRDVEFRHFADTLRAHEAAENRIMEECFGIEVE
jgi:hypothetical protein